MATATPALARTAWLLCGDAHRAEVVQQALMRTYLAWSTARQRDPLAYTRRTLANLRIDTWRKHRREVLTTVLPETSVEADADSTPSATSWSGRSPRSPRGSGGSSCCATWRASPSARSRTTSGCRSAP